MFERIKAKDLYLAQIGTVMKKEPNQLIWNSFDTNKFIIVKYSDNHYYDYECTDLFTEMKYPLFHKDKAKHGLLAVNRFIPIFTAFPDLINSNGQVSINELKKKLNELNTPKKVVEEPKEIKNPILNMLLTLGEKIKNAIISDEEKQRLSIELANLGKNYIENLILIKTSKSSNLELSDKESELESSIINKAIEIELSLPTLNKIENLTNDLENFTRHLK